MEAEQPAHVQQPDRRRLPQGAQRIAPSRQRAADPRHSPDGEGDRHRLERGQSAGQRRQRRQQRPHQIAEMPISVARPAAGLAVAPTVEELLIVDF